MGIECPKCGCGHVPVFSTRQFRRYTVRVRVCRFCSKKFSTREQIPRNGKKHPDMDEIDRDGN